MRFIPLLLALTTAFGLVVAPGSIERAAFAQSSDLKTVEAQGQGTTSREALEDAMRNAAERAVGVIVQSDTVARNYEIQSDRIRTQAEAFIESYDVLDERTGGDGLTSVRIKAVINQGSIKDGIRALAILQKRKHNPTFVVVNDYQGEDRGDFEANVAAAGAVNRYLGSRLLEVKDPRQVEQLRQDDGLIQEAQGHGVSVAQQIANKLKADVYVTVTGHVARSASLNVRFFESSTGRILGEESAYTSVLGGQLAEQKLAVEKATVDATDKAFNTLLNYWKRDTAQGSQVTVVANGLDFARKIKFRKILAQLGKDVKQLNASDGHAEFIIWSEQSPEELSEAIFEEALSANLKVSSHGPSERGSRLIFSFK